MSLFIRVLPLLFIPILMNCTSSKQTVRMQNVLNYDPNAAHHLLFLDFTIRRDGPGKPEQVILTNSVVGNGEMKAIGRAVHTPYQLQVHYYTTDNQPTKVDSLEHPLFRSIEIANTNGTIDRTLTTEQEGHFSLRFPYTKALTKLELYSRTPDQNNQKIYTLSIKP